MRLRAKTLGAAVVASVLAVGRPTLSGETPSGRLRSRIALARICSTRSRITRW